MKKNKLFIFLMYLGILLGGWGCSSGLLGLAPAGDRKEYSHARTLYEHGNYDLAITELQDYIYKTKNVRRREARAYRLLGLSYEKKGQFSKALETYLEALEFHPDNVPLLLEAARLYQQTNLTSRSMQLYERALQQEPNNPEALAGQAVNYTAMGFYSQARHFYDRFFEVNPTAPAQYRARYAHTFLEQRNYEQAFINITMALAEEKNNPDFWFLSAQARYGLKQLPQALLDLQAALTLAPQRPDLLGQQALWLFETGALEEAQQTTQRLLQVNPQSQLALWIQSLIALQQNKEQQALRLRKQIVQMDCASFIGRIAQKSLGK